MITAEDRDLEQELPYRVLEELGSISNIHRWRWKEIHTDNAY